MNHRWGALGLMTVCVVLVLCGVFVLGFLAEPSAVGRVRTMIAVIGAVMVVGGAAAGVFGFRMLVARRT